MVIILSVPIGVISLLVAAQCLRSGLKRHAIVCTLVGVFFLGIAFLMSYGTSVLVEQIATTI